MQSLNVIIATVFAVCSVFSATSAIAGPYSDDMTRCLVEATTDAEKNQLVKWMFSAISAHPAISSMSSISFSDREQINKETAEMFVTLLTETCREETVKSVKYEGPQSISIAFEVFGQVAAQGMFSNPQVAKEVANLGNYADKEKLKEIGLE